MLGAGFVVFVQGFRASSTSRTARWPCTGLFTFDTAWNRGEFYFPWVDFLPTTGLNIPVKITLSDSGTWPFAGVARPRTPHGRRSRSRRTLPGVPSAAPCRTTGQGRRFARTRAVPAGRRADQLRQLVPATAQRRPGGDRSQNFLGLGKVFPGNTLYVIGFAVLTGSCCGPATAICASVSPPGRRPATRSRHRESL